VQLGLDSVGLQKVLQEGNLAFAPTPGRYYIIYGIVNRNLAPLIGSPHSRRPGLTVNAKRDDRLNPEASTRAAAAYVRDLWLRFKDWRLVLAADNAGEDRVQKAIERAGTSDYQTLSAKRLIPEETRNYVPAALRAITLLQEVDECRLGGPEFAARLLYAVPTT